MPQFSYRARNAQGGLVEGVLNVADRSVAIRQIEQQNCIPIRIEAMTPAPQVVDGKSAAAVATPTQNLKSPAWPVAHFYRATRPPFDRRE